MRQLQHDMEFLSSEVEIAWNYSEFSVFFFKLKLNLFFLID
jgi:hypothetical protein